MSEKLFDYSLSNPPYQDEDNGSGYYRPLYPDFVDKMNVLSDTSVVVTPARWLWPSKGPEAKWSKSMRARRDVKILGFWSDSQDVFPNVGKIKGGIGIFSLSSDIDEEPIGDTFIDTSMLSLKSILDKVCGYTISSLENIVYPRTSYNLTDKLYDVRVSARDRVTKGHERDVASAIFDILPDVFLEDKPDDGHDYILVYGRAKNVGRCQRWVRRDFVDGPDCLENWTVLVPEAGGGGALGEVCPTSLIGPPLIGSPMSIPTETYICIGSFVDKYEVDACFKYIKSKFARVLLGICKRTQHNAPHTWRCVPLQDFTEDSDIDWSKSVAEIDQQLYKKYGLTEEEINFIETNVKEMV